MAAKTQNILVKFTINGSQFEGGVNIPVIRSPKRVLLPALQGVTDAIVGLAQREAESAGEKVSCRKGCDACCRQMVPLAPTEVFGLAAYLDGLGSAAAPILERFDRAVEALEERGLAEPLRQRRGFTPAQMQALDRAYFAAQIPCPLLENQACTLHAVRPLVCREYLVTSAACFCAQPEADKVRQVALGAKPSLALLKSERGAGWVPLVLAREFAAQHTQAQAAKPAEALRGILKRL